MSNKAIRDLELCKHPNSRKTIALTKQLKKVTKREKAKLGQVLKLNVVGEKLAWFKEHLIPDLVTYTPQLTLDLITSYLERFDEELEQINIKHSIGQRHKNRQHASREDIIRLTMKRELEEFDGCGIEMPDVMQPKPLESLRRWNGELRFLQNISLRRICRKYLLIEAEKTKAIDKISANPIMDVDN